MVLSRGQRAPSVAVSLHGKIGIEWWFYWEKIIIQCTRPTGFAVVALFSLDNAHHFGSDMIWLFASLRTSLLVNMMTRLCRHMGVDGIWSWTQHVWLHCRGVSQGETMGKIASYLVLPKIYCVFICSAWLLRKMGKNQLATHSMHLFIYILLNDLLIGQLWFLSGGASSRITTWTKFVYSFVRYALWYYNNYN
jgi:hypothetical protein